MNFCNRARDGTEGDSIGHLQGSARRQNVDRRMTLYFQRSESFAVAIVFVISVGLAMVSAIYIPAKVPAASPGEFAAIPATPEVALVDADRLAEHQQIGPETRPPETLRSQPPEMIQTSPLGNLSARSRGGSAPPGFRDLVWGNVPTVGMIEVGGPYGPQKRYIWRTKNKELAPVFGVAVMQESYLFQDGKLCGGEMLFDGLSSFQKVKDGITTLFGPPDFVDEAIQLFKWTWRAPDVELRISYREASRRATLHLERK
jgi:hypothetical protein